MLVPTSRHNSGEWSSLWVFSSSGNPYWGGPVFHIWSISLSSLPHLTVWWSWHLCPWRLGPFSGRSIVIWTFPLSSSHYSLASCRFLILRCIASFGSCYQFFVPNCTILSRSWAGSQDWESFFEVGCLVSLGSSWQQQGSCCQGPRCWEYNESLSRLTILFVLVCFIVNVMLCNHCFIVYIICACKSQLWHKVETWVLCFISYSYLTFRSYLILGSFVINNKLWHKVETYLILAAGIYFYMR